jgi:uncharacterized integral membrane protein
MRYLSWIIKLTLFILILSFALVNTDPVTVRYYYGYRWEAPLVLVLLVTVCIGAFAGALVGLLQTLRLRREIAALKREPGKARNPVPAGSAPAIMPPADLL